MSDDKSEKVKKNLIVLPLPGTTHSRIAWEGGGEVPPAISGAYTTPYMAKQAIAAWYAVNGREEQAEEDIKVTTITQVREKDEGKRYKSNQNKEVQPI